MGRRISTLETPFQAIEASKMLNNDFMSTTNSDDGSKLHSREQYLFVRLLFALPSSGHATE